MTDTPGAPDPQPEPKSDDLPVGRRFHIFAYIILPILMLLIGGLVTHFYGTYNNRLRALQYQVIPSSGIFPAAPVGDRPVKIMVGDQTVENLSTVGIAVYNPTDQDYEDVPLRVTFTGSAQVLHSHVSTPEGDSSEEQLRKPESRPGDVQIYTFSLPVVNRSGSEPVFRADFTFVGDKAPDVKVSVEEKGLVATRYEVGGDKDEFFSSKFFVILFFGIALSIIAGPVGEWLGRTSARRARARREAALAEGRASVAEGRA